MYYYDTELDKMHDCKPPGAGYITPLCSWQAITPLLTFTLIILTVYTCGDIIPSFARRAHAVQVLRKPQIDSGTKDAS